MFMGAGCPSGLGPVPPATSQIFEVSDVVAASALGVGAADLLR